MKFLKILFAFFLFFGIFGCGKKAGREANEVEEAGYKMTAEGWQRAIERNDVAILKAMVKGGFDAKTLDASGRDGLHVAAASGSKAAGEFFLNQGNAIDGRGPGGRTALMEAVLTDRAEMVRWLISQGADPLLKDERGFNAMALAATEGKIKVVEELAPYNRDELDAALLLAALVGKAEVIDVLTNYGASVYARMEDGRTALMVAAQNGHKEAAALLIEIGASRFATLESGETAQSMAEAAGHKEIARMIETGISGDKLAFETDGEVAAVMEQVVEKSELEPAEPSEEVVVSEAGARSFPSEAGGGADSASVETEDGPGVQMMKPEPLEGAQISAVGATAAVVDTQQAAAEIPLVMRQFRQRELPVEVRKVSGGVASLKLVGAAPRDVQVRAGDAIPGSNLVVVKVFNRIEQGKLNNSQPLEIGIVEVEDVSTGQRREWIAGRSATGHDPVALVEDAATGRRYLAKPGQKFTSEDGREFIVNDVRPGQLIIEDTSSGEVWTLSLRGARG